MRATRAASAAGIAAAATVLAAASFAWACTPQARIKLSPKEGPAGTVVQVYGSNFGSGPVEIRWGSLGGTKLADAQGPGFTVDVTIPTAPAGTYTVLGVYRSPLGTYSPPAAFTVTTSSGTAGNSGGGNGSGNATGTQPAGSGSSSVQPGGTGETSPAEAGQERSGSGAEPRAGAGRNPSGGEAAPDPFATTDAPSSAAMAAAEGPAGAGPSAAERRSAGVSGGGVRTVASGAAASVAGAPGDRAAAPSPATAVGDLWRGFAPGRPLPAGAPLLDEPVSSGAGSELALGMGLLSVGVVAMFAGFAISAVRRRPVPTARSRG